MSGSSEDRGGGGEAPAQTPPAYEPPSIIWEEPYEPIGFGVSCARQEGNPGCFPGPTFQ